MSCCLQNTIALISPSQSSQELLATLNSRVYVNRAGYWLPETRIYVKNHVFYLKTCIFPPCLTIGILGFADYRFNRELGNES
jgi:hypothetical protein